MSGGFPNSVKRCMVNDITRIVVLCKYIYIYFVLIIVFEWKSGKTIGIFDKKKVEKWKTIGIFDEQNVYFQKCHKKVNN